MKAFNPAVLGTPQVNQALTVRDEAGYGLLNASRGLAGYLELEGRNIFFYLDGHTRERKILEVLEQARKGIVCVGAQSHENAGLASNPNLNLYLASPNSMFNLISPRTNQSEGKRSVFYNFSYERL
jgi:hypothetical protein